MSKIVLNFSAKMIEQVLAEWERENPGKNADEMSGEEFSDRVMAKIKASMTVVSKEGTA